MTDATTPAVQTFIRKDLRSAWRAESTVRLAHLSASGKGLELSILTRKHNSGGLLTSATVSEIDGTWRVHSMYQDYSKRLAYTDSRCTEKNVEKQHAAALADHLATVLAECKAKYAPELFAA